MGDRGNIVIMPDVEAPPLYLYTHWGGSNLPSVVQCGVRRIIKAGRATDPHYGARLLFQELTKGMEDNDLGYGLSTYLCDYEVAFTTIKETDQGPILDREVSQYPFLAYVKLSASAARKALQTPCTWLPRSNGLALACTSTQGLLQEENLP